jgi:beta-lactam-binding protein with PASTA domain
MNRWMLALLVAVGGCQGVATADSPKHDVVKMPDVHNMLRKDAEAKIRAAGLTGEIVLYNHDKPDFSKWTVVNQTPSEDQMVYRDFEITLSYADPHPKTVEDERPKLEGMAVEDAKKKMRELGYIGTIDIVNITTNVPKDCKQETVCWIEPIRWYFDYGVGHASARIMTILPLKIKAPD